ncbi:MAG: YceD family protein [Actinomycetota bacterium]|nr:YceD family protein [Actinomycetota bacterium]
MSKLSEVFKLNTFELPRRPGEMKEYELDIELSEKVGIELIAVPVGGVIEVDARLESVAQGILLSAQIFAVAAGECGRCLDPVEVVIDKRVQELYLYEPKAARKNRAPLLDELDIEDELFMDGDLLDLQSPIRDAIVLALPSNPLCSDECAGLCPSCGGKWSQLSNDHAHEVIDSRWAGLAGLGIDDSDFKN